MKWHIAFYLAGTLLLFHAGAALGKPLQGEYVPGELLIKYKQGRSSTAEQSRGGGRLQSMRRVHRFGIEHVKVPSGMSMEEAVRLLEKDPNVDFVEPNYIRRRTAVPNDLLFGLQWALSNTGQTVNKVAGTVDADIDAVEAWDREIGNSDIVVAVLDTGIDWRHPDLKENIRINSGDETPDGVDDDANGFIDDFRGWDFVDGDNDPMDIDGHGTHVAGTLGSDGNNAIGTAGVAWKVGLMPLRFLDVYGVGTVADEIEAIDYAIQKGVRIINASYGGAQYSQSEFDALARAQKAGILVVAAAGNASRNNDTIPEYPASYSASQKPDDTTVLHNIIAVAASTQDDTLASFSSFGAVSVDVAAPGVNVAATMSEPPVAFEDFENDISGWSLESPWAVTAARGHGISNRSLADSPDGNYTNGLDIVAESPTIELEGQTGLVLTFFLRGKSEQPDGEKEGDRLFVETNSGNGWTNHSAELGGTVYADGISGSFDPWVKATVELGDLDRAQNATLRFRFQTDENGTMDGFNLDTLELRADVVDWDDNYVYLSGTSMATAHVSGLAALLLSQNPSLSVSELRAGILDHVDVLSSLEGKVATGGRINAARSLGVDVAQVETMANEESAGGGGGGGGCVLVRDAPLGLEWVFLLAVLVLFRKIAAPAGQDSRWKKQ